MAFHKKEMEKMMGTKVQKMMNGGSSSKKRKGGKKKSAKFVSAKIRKIKKEGIRGKKVPQKQAIAVALSMARKKGLKVKKG